ncbi:lasso RiPP family leader peptide-containing protein [Goodfellowiella coeruleoviolacea]|nr:lasso RiPP family leader peptide-containing protein [Goodfellowiella coeruleoviolacea]
MDEQTTVEYVPPMLAEVGQFSADTLGAFYGDDETGGTF